MLKNIFKEKRSSQLHVEIKIAWWFFPEKICGSFFVQCGLKKTVPQNKSFITFETLKIMSQNFACVFSN